MDIKKSIWKQRIGYGIADLGCNLIWQMLTIYQMYFYTDVMGLAVAKVGIIFLLVRVIDGGADLLIGYLIDNTQTRWGKSRPYFLWGALPFAVFSALCFYAPIANENGKVAYAFLTYLGLSITYTMVNLPLTSILPSLTTDLRERTNLATTRILFSFIGATIVGSFTVSLLRFFGGQHARLAYFHTMALYGSAAAMMLVLSFFTVRESASKTSVRTPLNVAIRSLLSNRPWLIFASNIIFMWGAFFLQQSTLIYYYTYCARSTPAFIQLITTLNAVFPAVGTLATPFLTHFMGKRKLFIYSSIIHLGGTIFLCLAGNTGALLITGTVISALGFGLRQAVYFSMQADPVDYGQRKTGLDMPGLISALNQFIGKISMGASGVIAGLLLYNGGYQANVFMTGSAVRSIQTAFLYLPIVFVCVSIFIMSFYPVDRGEVLLKQR